MTEALQTPAERSSFRLSFGWRSSAAFFGDFSFANQRLSNSPARGGGIGDDFRGRSGRGGRELGDFADRGFFPQDSGGERGAEWGRGSFVLDFPPSALQEGPQFRAREGEPAFEGD